MSPENYSHATGLFISNNAHCVNTGFAFRVIAAWIN